VKIDPTSGRVLYYRTYRRTRTGQYVDQQEIPPAAFIHLTDPVRSDEYRGTSKLLPVLNDLRDIRETFEAEKMAIKTQASYAAMVSTRDPYNNTGPGAWTGTTAEGTPSQDAIWGKILKMAEGENFSMLTPSARPSGAFMAFFQILVRKMATALGFSYGLLWDLSALGGVSQRIEVQADLRRIQYIQENILIKALNRIRRKVIAQGIALQAIPPHPLWRKDANWNFGPYITADLGYEMEADIQGITAGIVPVASVVAKYGTTTTEVFSANADAANDALGVGATKGLPVETFARGLYPQITAEKAAFDTPTPLPAPPPLSIQAIGDKGLKILVEIQEQVGEGKIDRESAIETLLRAFPGTSRSDAEKIIPGRTLRGGPQPRCRLNPRRQTRPGRLRRQRKERIKQRIKSHRLQETGCGEQELTYLKRP
jgi:capsid protein